MKKFIFEVLKNITTVILLLLTVPFIVLLVISIIPVIAGKNEVATDKSVAVIEVVGEIKSSKEIVQKIHKQIKNDKVKGLVLRVNSPGGDVGASQDIYYTVSKLKSVKPIVASFGSTAASGGLYVSLGASKIFAQPGTITGSIGVIFMVPNFTSIADKLGFKLNVIKSGQLKDVGNPFREMSDVDREFLQGTVARVQEDFVDAVVSGRGIQKEKVLTFADGRVILGTEAKELGLIDQFGGVYEAARAVLELAGEPLGEGEQPRLYYPKEDFEQILALLDAVTGIGDYFNAQSRLKYISF